MNCQLYDTTRYNMQIGAPKLKLDGLAYRTSKLNIFEKRTIPEN